MGPKLLLATNNLAKVREYKDLLRKLPYELVTVSELGISITVNEVGETLEENARLKAMEFAAQANILAFADDSGLAVDILGGEPGPLSARYAGKMASDRDRVDYLLARLDGVPWDRRSACFKCVIAIATPNGEVELCAGECYGTITFEPRGEQGFGYDPVFYLPTLKKTMAELTLAEKNQISHRGQAVKKAYSAQI